MNWCDLRPALSAATRCVLLEAEHPARREAYCEPLKASALKHFSGIREITKFVDVT